jgi:hypothetical protein
MLISSVALFSLSLFSFRFTLICGKMVFWPLDISAHDQFADSSRHTLSISKWYWRIMNPREALFSLRELSEWNTLQLWSIFFLMVFMFNSRMFHHLLVRSTLLWFARSLARSDYTWSVAQGFQVGDLFTGTNVEREVMCIQSDSTSQNTKVTSPWTTILPPLPSYDYDYDFDCDSICFQSLSSLTHVLSHSLTHTHKTFSVADV